MGGMESYAGKSTSGTPKYGLSRFRVVVLTTAGGGSGKIGWEGGEEKNCLRCADFVCDDVVRIVLIEGSSSGGGGKEALIRLENIWNSIGA